MAIYDTIGVNYSKKRQTDSRIASQIVSKLYDAKKIVNIGAGAGSYEPPNFDLIAVEPSLKMINQRASDSYPVIQAKAEALPFSDNSFTHAMTVLSMHHWTNILEAFQEINRVTTERFIAVSWNPQSSPFWLTKDYFPEIFEIDQAIFPKINLLERYFSDIEIEPLMIPADCSDGFLAAYWKRPEEYLDPEVRHSISSFSKISNISSGLKKLESDLKTGKWYELNESLLNKNELDVGYVVISGNTNNT